MKRKPDSAASDELRRQAEEMLNQDEKKTIKELNKTNADLQKLVHELQVHQIELEIQNEELRRTRLQLANTLDMYVELYMLARVGYFTLTRDGIIRAVNAAGAKLIGIELKGLKGQRFDSFVSLEDRMTFRAFLHKLFTSSNKAVCEISLQKDWSARLPVHMVGACDVSDEHGGTCYLLVSEIPAPSRAK